jgi:parvulin-like peptidyl-prolyl isomerase
MTLTEERSGGSRRPIVLLVLGMAAGVVMAAAGLTTGGGSDSLPSDLVALVNGQPIRAEEFERLLAALDTDRRNGLAPDDRRHVLDRLIDEELLVQRGLELGLMRQDRRLRAGLTGAVIASVVAAPRESEPDDARLRSFYMENGDFFRRLGRIHVRQIFVRAAGDGDSSRAAGRAGEATRRWKAGEDYSSLAAELGDRPLAPLPDAPLPVAKLRDYLGPSVARAVLDLETGEISEPIRSASGFHVVQVVAREGDSTPPFEDVRTQVAEEFRRRADERALRAYLDELRSRSRIVVADELQ